MSMLVLGVDTQEIDCKDRLQNELYSTSVFDVAI